jgi:hypothetical protein
MGLATGFDLGHIPITRLSGSGSDRTAVPRPVIACNSIDRLPSEALCGTTQHQFRDFQILFVKHRFGSPGKVVHFARHTKSPSLLQKLAPEFCREECRPRVFVWRKIKMHARPELRQHLVARAMQKWALIGRYPSAHPNISPSRARRNFSRLLAKYPELAARLRLDALSPYPPL